MKRCRVGTKRGEKRGVRRQLTRRKRRDKNEKETRIRQCPPSTSEGGLNIGISLLSTCARDAKGQFRVCARIIVVSWMRESFDETTEGKIWE